MNGGCRRTVGGCWNWRDRRVHLDRGLKRTLTCAAVQSLSITAGTLSLAIEGAHRGEAVIDTTLPGKPRCTTGASPSAGYIRFRTASRQSAAASRRRSAELCYATSYLGLGYKRVQLRSETRGEVRPTNSRTRLGLFCNAEYDRCGGTECYDDQARNTHRVLRSEIKSEIIPHDLASNDNSGDEASARLDSVPKLSTHGFDATETSVRADA
jgi:hypothetical protein